MLPSEKENYDNVKKHLDLQFNKLFFQIGTNDGNDAFRLLVEEYEPEKIFLVEPWGSLYEKIHKSYNGQNYTLIEGVIHDKKEDDELSFSPSEAVLYFPENAMNDTGHSTLVPVTNWNKEELTPRKAPAYNFNDICHKHNITEIEFLMLDTEGYDNVILNSINFNKVKINNIMTENFGFDTEEYYTDYRERDFLGKTGMDNIYKKLTKLNYKRVKLEYDTLFVLQ